MPTEMEAALIATMRPIYWMHAISHMKVDDNAVLALAASRHERLCTPQTQVNRVSYNVLSRIHEMLTGSRADKIKYAKEYKKCPREIIAWAMHWGEGRPTWTCDLLWRWETNQSVDAYVSCLFPDDDSTAFDPPEILDEEVNPYRNGRWMDHAVLRERCDSCGREGEVAAGGCDFVCEACDLCVQCAAYDIEHMEALPCSRCYAEVKRLYGEEIFKCS